MDPYRLNGEPWLHPTPAGAYHAIAQAADDAGRRLIRRLLRTPETPRADAVQLGRWLGLDPGGALAFVHRLQAGALLQGLAEPLAVPPQSIEALLPPLLAQLSSTGCALLAEPRGLYVAKAGFTHEAAEELAALGADLAAVHARHAALLHGNLGLRGDGWGLVGAGGCAEIGFWPLHLGGASLILAVAGEPAFNQEAFTTLAWILGVRYGGPPG